MARTERGAAAISAEPSLRFCRRTTATAAMTPNAASATAATPEAAVSRLASSAHPAKASPVRVQAW